MDFFRTPPLKAGPAIETNKQTIDQCAALGAPVLVLVCGADPAQNVATNLQQIVEGIAAVAPYAAERGVTLAIEPLHPTYAGNRSAVTSMASANYVAGQINADNIGIALDVYHVFWEHDLEAQIKIAAKNGWLTSFHVCDYKAEPNHLLLDRGLMGEGVIDIRGIRQWVEAAGFTGFNEVEVFSQHWWSQNQHNYLQEIVRTYHEHV